MPKIKETFLLFSLLVPFSCIQNNTDQLSFSNQEQGIHVNLSPGWSINGLMVKQHKIVIRNDSDYQVFAGNIVPVHFSDSIYIYDLKVSLTEGDAKRPVEYMLYLNNQYAGRYSDKHRINISDRISSLQLNILNTGYSNQIKGWDEDNFYEITRDTSIDGITNLQIQLTIDSLTNNKKLILKSNNNVPENKRHDSYNKLLVPRPFIFKITDRKKKSEIQQFLDTDKNGKINIHQIRKDANSKKITDEISFGIWFNQPIQRDSIGFMIENYINRNSGLIKTRKNYTGKAHFKDSVVFNPRFSIPVYFDFPEHTMLNVTEIDSNFHVEIPYASENNVFGEKLYECNSCFLRYKVIKDLLKVKNLLSLEGYGIMLLDCYRPLDIQKRMYKKFPVKGYVADTIGGSIHNRGSAVDICLTDLSGQKVDMGSEYDEFSVRSHISYRFITDSALHRRMLLRQTMMNNHFVPIRMEWWHFEYDVARSYKKLNDFFHCSDEW